MLLDYYMKKLDIDTMPVFLKKYLDTKCIRRLKYITYLCGMDYASKDIYNFSEPITRFDHSLTTSLLVWKYTHNKEMTIAALFHDVATPCFSHVIDYMNKDFMKQESTEEYQAKIINGYKELNNYFEQDYINKNNIINFKNFSLVDSDRPKLCADRLDGIILTGISWTKDIKKEFIDRILDNTDIYTNEFGEEEFGFKDNLTTAIVYKLNLNIDKYCHSNEDNYMMCLLANIISKSINNGFITYNDLYRYSEKNLLEKLKKQKDEDILFDLYMFENIKKEEIPKIDISTKSKDINPLVKGKRMMKGPIK